MAHLPAWNAHAQMMRAAAQSSLAALVLVSRCVCYQRLGKALLLVTNLALWALSCALGELNTGQSTLKDGAQWQSMIPLNIAARCIAFGDMHHLCTKHLFGTMPHLKVKRVLGTRFPGCAQQHASLTQCGVVQGSYATTSLVS